MEDLPEGIRFRVTPERAWFGVVWNYIYPTFLAYLLTGAYGDTWPWQRFVVILGAGLGAGLWLSRQRQIVTTINRDGVRIQGTVGLGLFSPRWIPLVDISELRWQPESVGGADSTSDPSGLYARRGLFTLCLLPYLDPTQTQRAILAIERRFSWVERTPGSTDTLLFTDDLVRLGLDR